MKSTPEESDAWRRVMITYVARRVHPGQRQASFSPIGSSKAVHSHMAPRSFVVRARYSGSRSYLAVGMTVLTATVWLGGFGSDWAVAAPSATCTAGTCTVSFAETGAVQNWTVPAGVDHITVTAAGGSGGTGAPYSGAPSPGGTGGKVTATVPVQAGDALAIVVGAAGADGTPNSSTIAAGGYGGGASAGSVASPNAQGPGGGGGGGSLVFDTSAQPSLLVAAGGGGGSGCFIGANPRTGGAGGAGGDAGVTPAGDGWAGAGATTTAPGAGGSTGGGIGTGSPGAAAAATSPTALGLGGSGATNT
ncbi:MAG: hypothetical protein QOK10_2496, partial [Pseudonocardiales bacterium]|nr:hypothetical protein [Pseudonocardiales bacterium]